MIRVFDAFSGIGGFRSGLERVGGFEFVAWCEIDKFAQKAYRALYDTGGEQFYENIRNIDAGELADFDLLTGGFPCQPFSVCGARKGFADERGDLFFELARILESKRPRYFLLENVPGLLGIDSGRTFAKIIETLCELGYCVVTDVQKEKSQYDPTEDQQEKTTDAPTDHTESSTEIISEESTESTQSEPPQTDETTEVTITKPTEYEEETEPPMCELSDYEKALEVYNLMTVNGGGTCVQYAYQTYEMCCQYGLECYFAWTENRLYGHVANVVNVDGVWYVLDTQAGCFLTENMCGFTEIVDSNESYIASAEIISSVRYE